MYRIIALLASLYFAFNQTESSCTNCSNCSRSGKCYTCKEGYYRIDNSCERCSGNCLSCYDIGDCKSCKAGYYGRSCQTQCSDTCLGGACFKHNGTCTEPCFDGYYGERCNRQCPEKCWGGKCQKWDGDCTAGCIKGYHGRKCSESCPSTCLNGECGGSVTYCIQGCIEGHYGKVCDKRCPESCRNGRCDETTGSCIEGCIDGFYLNQKGCMRCPSDDTCYPCRSGYFGQNCSRKCDICKELSCNSLTGRCTYGCVDGFFLDGNDCKRCPYPCDTCSSRDTCTSCLPGLFGDNCRKTCVKCKKYSCDFNSGRCNEGCTEGHYMESNTCKKCPDRCMTCVSAKHCLSCKAGYFDNRKCNKTCPEHCLLGKCDILGGKCQEGCEKGNYGWKCDRKCHENCIDGRCDVETGRCECDLRYYIWFFFQNCECPQGHFSSGNTMCIKCPLRCMVCSSRDSCISCKPGLYGQYCNLTCSTCKNYTCNIYSGECTRGCTDGHIWDNGECIQCPIGCISCSSKNTCITCSQGYFGRTCSERCSIGCLDKCCDKTTAICTKGCVKGYFGYRCENKCSTNCIDDKCKTPTGHCTKGCNKGYFGPRCSWKCSILCANNSCDDRTGACTDGCIDGYFDRSQQCVCGHGTYGVHCGYNCSITCAPVTNNLSTCWSYDGTCRGGCLKGHTGPMCDKLAMSEPSTASTNVVVSAVTIPIVVFAVVVAVALAIYRSSHQSTNQPETNPGEYTNVVPVNARSLDEMMNNVYHTLDVEYENTGATSPGGATCNTDSTSQVEHEGNMSIVKVEPQTSGTIYVYQNTESRQYLSDDEDVFTEEGYEIVSPLSVQSGQVSPPQEPYYSDVKSLPPSNRNVRT